MTPVSPLTAALRNVSFEGMARIVLLGPAGSGKTRLARRYAMRTGAALICLDAIWAGDVEAFRAEIARLHAGEAWISDGNFAAVSFDIRLPRATEIIWLEAPRWLSIVRAVRRPFRADSDHALHGLPKALAFIWNFERRNRPLIERLRQEKGPQVPVRRLRTKAEIAVFLTEAA
jgi:adenylate kinase family enzyme